MFQLNPDVIDLVQTFNEKTKDMNTSNGLTTLAIVLCVVTLALMVITFLYRGKYLLFTLIAITVTSILGLSVIKKELNKERETESIFEQYNATHANKIGDTNTFWLTDLVKSNENFENKLIQIYDTDLVMPWHRKLKPNQYIQAKPAPEGDAPMVKTRIVIKNDAQKHKDYQTKLTTDDVQLIKIETIDNQTMVTAHVKVKGQSYKIEVSELVLDKMLQSKTAFYYDEEKGQLVVGL